MRTHHGFSLVELSIVLVILGLLTGGILAGQSLIRASELRTISTDFGRYQAAIGAFRDKYFQIPGDFSMATRFWTAAASCAATTTTTTCNGSGNGKIDTGTQWEGQRFWQHLAMSGLIEGAYDGKLAMTNASQPAARIGSGAVYAIPYRDSPDSAYYSFFTPGGGAPGTDPVLMVGKTGYDSDNGTNVAGAGGVLRPEEAWNIDTKMDDANSVRGRLQTLLTDASYDTVDGAGNCNTVTPYQGAYPVGDRSVFCAFGIKIF